MRPPAEGVGVGASAVIWVRARADHVVLPDLAEPLPAEWKRF